MAITGVDSEKVHRVVSEIKSKCDAILSSVDALKNTWEAEVVGAKGLQGHNADALTNAMRDSIHPKLKQANAEVLNAFKADLVKAGNALLEAGGNAADLSV